MFIFFPFFVGSRLTIAGIITLVIFYFLLSKTVAFLSRNEETEIHQSHIAILLLATLLSGLIGFTAGSGSTALVYAALTSSISALAIAANVIALTYRTSILIALTTPPLLFFSVWLGKLGEQLIIRVLLS